MDGDKAPIELLVKLKNVFDSLLYIDEAHSFGLYSEQGQGVSFSSSYFNEIDLIVGTFGKAIGGYGAFVVCNSTLKEYLINHARSFIYSTALPLPLILWNSLAIKKMILMSTEREYLLRLSEEFRESLKNVNNVEVYGKDSLIISLVSDINCLKDFKKRLNAININVPLIRYPTVPKGKERLRFSITAHHSKCDLEKVINALS